MLTRVQRIYRFCRGDGSLTLAVGVLVTFVFLVEPLVELGVANSLVTDVVFALFLWAGARFVFQPRTVMRLFLLFLGATVAVRVLGYFILGRWLIILDAAMTATSAFLLGTLLLARVLRDGRVNIHRIMGAVGTFLLIGAMFTQTYRLVALLGPPGAFSVGGAPATADVFLPLASYYSYVTLASLGYGDVTPLNPFARSLATLEALSGQLFLAILVARLVALEVEWKQAQREARWRHSPPPERDD
jgi:hypothetical protein